MTANAAARVSKNAGVLVIGNVMRMLFNFGLVIYAARLLGVEGFGKYALGLQFFELFLWMSAAGLCILLTREVAADKSRTNELLSAALVVVTPMTIVAGLLLIAMARLIGYDATVQSAVLLASLALLPAAVALVLEALFIAHERAELVTLGLTVESGLNVGLAVLLLSQGYGIPSLFVVLIATRCTMLLLYVLLMHFSVARFRWTYHATCVRHLVRNGRLLTAEIWVSTLNVNFAVVALSIVHGEAAVGLFVAAQKLLRPGALVAQSCVTAIFPYMSRLFRESRERFNRLGSDGLRLMILLALPMAITITLLADPIMALVYSDEYLGASAILQVSIWALMFMFFNPFLSRLLVAQGRADLPLWIAAAKLCFLFTLPLWLIYRYSAVGAAWAGLLADVLAFALFCATALGVVPSRATIANGLRIIAPALALAAFVWLFRDTSHLWLFLLGLPLYVVLLFVCRAFSWGDLKPLVAGPQEP